MTDQQSPHPPLEDWLPALRHTRLDGALFWIVNEEYLIVDATPDLANAAGIPISSYIGSKADAIALQVIDPPLKVRQERLARLFREGGSDSITLWANLPGRGWTCGVVTTTRITHPDTGKHYLMNSAHDITDLSDQLEYLRAPAFQGLIMLIIEKDGKVLAATDAAARFCNPTLNRGEDLCGYTIDQTQWVKLKEREADQLRLSWVTGKPAHAIEWLLSGGNDYRPYAVSRIGFPKGRWMIVMIPVPLTAPFMQLESIQDVVKANNINQPARVKAGEFKTLVDLYNKTDREVLAMREGITVDGIDGRRRRLVDKFGLDSVEDLLPSLRHTELGYLVQLYAERVSDEGGDSPGD